MAQRRGEIGAWPPKLAEFHAEDWPPAPGETELSCGCAPCRKRFGPPRPAGSTVADARRRWRAARLATFERGTREFKREALAAIYESRLDHFTDNRKET